MQSDIEEFRQKVRAYFKDYQTSGGGEYVLYDVVLAPEDVPAALEVIKKYQPLGQGVPNPVCRINQFAVDAPFYMGADKSHIKFRARTSLLWHSAWLASMFSKGSQSPLIWWVRLARTHFRAGLPHKLCCKILSPINGPFR